MREFKGVKGFTKNIIANITWINVVGWERSHAVRFDKN